MKRFVIGDIHGAHRALLQCFERSGFDKQEDLLISLGDLCDGWPDVEEVLDELLDVRNLILILGNHDQWMINWFNTGEIPDIWLMQGGNATIQSFRKGVSARHKQFLNSARLYYILENNLFVHGGIIPDMPLELQTREVFLWDRSLVQLALSHKQYGRDFNLTPFDCVYVGHTPTINFGEPIPISTCGVYLMDTGAGWPGGVLTMINIDSGELYSSDMVNMLYTKFLGRQ